MDNETKKTAVEAENSRDGYAVHDTTAVVMPTAMSSKVKGKLLEDDITVGQNDITNSIRLSRVSVLLCNSCKHIQCNVKDCGMLRARPRGSQYAKVMFINKMPSKFETACGMSMCDEKGMLISVILNKMGVPMESVYFTDIIKCHGSVSEADWIKQCISEYIKEEIDVIKPKVIIANGVSILRMLKFAGIITQLPETIEYGKIYECECNGTKIKVIGVYELEKVLMKQKDDLAKCKSELWTQLSIAFTELGMTNVFATLKHS